MGIVYLIQPTELVGTDRYKLGCSRESCTRRVDLGYNDGTVVHLVEHVDDPFEVERALVQRFNDRFSRVGGREFFAGDVKQMLKCFKAVTETLLPPEDDETTIGGGDEDDTSIKCPKCNKQFTRKDNMKVHAKKCNGPFNSKQCQLCFKVFTTSRGRWKHNKYVDCLNDKEQL